MKLVHRGMMSQRNIQIRATVLSLLVYSIVITTFGNKSNTVVHVAETCVKSQNQILPQFLGTGCDFSDPHIARIVSAQEMETEEARDILAALGEELRFHRKQWEYVSIVRALRRANMLRPGKRGLVFAAGSEPLISYFASFGPEILATDLPYERALQKGWVYSNEHADSLNSLYRKESISRDDFNKRVSFQTADMNRLNESWFGSFDFLWTTCSMEHIGSIALGMKFARESMKLLKPSGFAIHTTEFLLSSLTDTVTEGPTCFWRLHDVEELLTTLKVDGHKPSNAVCLKTGNNNAVDYDLFPYSSYNHTRLLVEERVITSVFWTATRKP
jgi:hypothetical protein